MTNILQGNLRGCREANDIFQQTALEKDIDLAMVSEQYRNSTSGLWIPDNSGRSAIWLPKQSKLTAEKRGAGDGFAWITSSQTTYFSCYLSPNQSIDEYERQLHSLEDQLRVTEGKVIIGGDFNARAIEWGMPKTNARGSLILEMAARAGLAILNVGNVPTLQRYNSAGTIPDISLASESIAVKIYNWKVLDDFTASDHQWITFTVGGSATTARNTPNRPLRYRVEKADRKKFDEVISKGVHLPENRPQTPGDKKARAESIAKQTMKLLTKACDTSMPVQKTKRNKRAMYWWNQEIADLRKKNLKLRREWQRAKSMQEKLAKAVEQKAAKKELRYAINRSKAECWNKLREDTNQDPWGMGYKLVTKKLGGLQSPAALDTTTMNHIVETLFPAHPKRLPRNYGEVQEVPLFQKNELQKVVHTLKNKKAPGPDRIPNEALKFVADKNSDLLLNMYNSCLEAGIFYDKWKEARLVLIDKGKGEPGTPSNYRPLCMLDTAGKVYEKLIKLRLTPAIEEGGGLSERQYGFRAGRSTIDAVQNVVEVMEKAENHNHHSRRIVLLVLLDVRNAFNTLRWEDVINAVEHTFQVPTYLLRVLGDYLNNRKLLFSTKEGQRSKDITSGAAQGSILGPDLWNIVYDSLLRMEMPEETRLVAYADDVAALIADRTIAGAQLKLNQVMRKIEWWMEERGLSLALQKTEIVVLTKKRIETILPLKVGEETVGTKKAAKYLGVTIDNRMNFAQQIKAGSEKAEKYVRHLSRLMANIGGPRASKRRLMMEVTNSILLYGAEVWGEKLEMESYRKHPASVQRRAALRIASAYRTVSEPAVLVIASVIPIVHLARERIEAYRAKRQIEADPPLETPREVTLRRWQTEWESEERGGWTSLLIPQVSPWVQRGHGEVNYYLTQLLSGHGYFKAYLMRMGKTDSDRCDFCPNEKDDPEHTFFKCERWKQLREELTSKIGPFSPRTIVPAMLKGPENWMAVTTFSEKLLKTKKSEWDP